jgi:hypothetical protein
LFAGADCGITYADEQQQLHEEQIKLSARIETLEREQDYLIFQRAMYASDSKYLIINISKKTGQLRYKNRVLKDIAITLVSGRIKRLKPGALTLSQKIEGPRARKMLVFGDVLALQGRKSPQAELDEGMPRFSLSLKDIKSLYAALESGAKLYILP